jgi:hypothetical protein
MTTTLRRLFRNTTRRTRSREAVPARPQVEGLEDRRVPTVTFHGGAVLPNVEVQGVYYGSDWNTAAYSAQRSQLDGFLQNVVQSSYMDMLTKAGYGTGRGSFSSGQTYAATLDKTTFLTDSTIRSNLQSCINAGAVQQPDSNRLYVVFVEDNVAVQNNDLWDSVKGRYDNSIQDFLAYHWAFAGTDSSGRTQDIHYAIITYPGGSVGNASRSWLNALDTMTLSASHELAEAVTDPNVNYKTLSWYDDTLNGENGDITNAQTVYLNGYAVQRIPDKNDQAMTPQGARPVNPVNFVLSRDGNLYMSSGAGNLYMSGGLTWLQSGIASISDQGIDNFGHAMIDVVNILGYASEYHEGLGTWTFLARGVTSARAGQGVSYYLDTTGTAHEYKDWGFGAAGDGPTRTSIDATVTAIDAGTDRFGVNMMTEVKYGYGYEHSDSTGWHYLGGYGVKAVSAGQQGNMAILYTSGTAYSYFETANNPVYLATNVAQVTAGTDQYGNPTIDLLYKWGDLLEYRAGGWLTLNNGVASISKGHAGVVDIVFNSGYAYSHDATGWWSYLGINTAALAA